MGLTITEHEDKLDQLRSQYPDLHRLLVAMVDETADADALSLLARAKSNEIEFRLNSGDLVTVGLGTRISKNGGKPGTVLQWLGTYDIYAIRGMLISGDMVIEGYDPN